MRKVLYATLAFLCFAPLVFSISVDYSTIPPVLYPGTNGKILLKISTQVPVEDIEVRFGDSAFSVYGKNRWEDVGDLYSGTTVYDAGLTVPSDLAPGTYVLPLRVRYRIDGNGTYNEYYALVLSVEPREELTVSVDGSVDENILNEVSVHLHTDKTLYGVRVYLSKSVEGFRYIGEFKGDKDVVFNVIPMCTGGRYVHTVRVVGYDSGGSFEYEKNIMVVCRPHAGVSVSLRLPSSVLPGEYNSVIVLRNDLDVGLRGIGVNVFSDGAVLTGRTEYYISGLSPHETLRLPVHWKTGDSEKVTLFVTVNGKRYAFSTYVQKQPDLMVYLEDAPTEADRYYSISLGIANAGTKDASNIVVRLDGNYVAFGNVFFVGDLSPGDYDSISFLVDAEPGAHIALAGKVFYTVDGVRKVQDFKIGIEIPRKDRFPYELLILIPVGYLIYRRFRK